MIYLEIALRNLEDTRNWKGGAIFKFIDIAFDER